MIDVGMEMPGVSVRDVAIDSEMHAECVDNAVKDIDVRIPMERSIYDILTMAELGDISIFSLPGWKAGRG
jgi:hypothetical protein